MNDELSQQALQGLASLIVSPTTELYASVSAELEAAGLLKNGTPTEKGVNLVVTLAMAGAAPTAQADDAAEEVEDETQEAREWANNTTIEFDFLDTRYSIALADVFKIAAESGGDDAEDLLLDTYERLDQDVTSNICAFLLDVDWSRWAEVSLPTRHVGVARLNDLFEAMYPADMRAEMHTMDALDYEPDDREGIDDLVAAFDESDFLTDLQKQADDAMADVSSIDIDPDLLSWASNAVVEVVTDTLEVIWLPRLVIRAANLVCRAKRDVVYKHALQMLASIRESGSLEVLADLYTADASLTLASSTTPMVPADVLRMFAQENDNVLSAKDPRHHDTMPAVTSV